MSAMGQTRKSAGPTAKSALAALADIVRPVGQVREGPTTEVAFALDHLVGGGERVRHCQMGPIADVRVRGVRPQVGARRTVCPR
jgi:hypothetical protein